MSTTKRRTTTGARKTKTNSRSPRPRRIPLAQAVALHRGESREQAERWLDRKTELENWLDRYQSLYEEAPVGHATVDARGVLLEVNPAAAALIGEPRARLLGKPLLCYVERGDTSLLLAHLARCAHGSATSELRLHNGIREATPVQLVSKRTWFPGSVGPAYHTVLTDITDRRRSEQALRASEKRHREIVETANEGICIVNAQNQIVFVNRRLASMVGGVQEDFAGRSAYDLVPDEDIEEARRAFAQRDTGDTGQSEQRLRRLDGSTVWTSVSTSRMRDERGAFAGILRMYTDNTARRELAQTREMLVRQLVEAQEQERQRIARELHDQMGQHIVALSLGLARLGSLTAEMTAATEVVHRLQAVTDMLGKDVHTLAIELRPAALDHLGLSVALGSYAENLASRTGLEIDVHCDDISDLSIPADVQTGIYRIAQEALTNIVKHAAAHHVSVILERQPDALHLIVEDDGVGFDPAHRRNTGKSCIGLAGMEERASLIEATLTIESTSDRGTTVYLRLPFLIQKLANNEETPLAPRR